MKIRIAILIALLCMGIVWVASVEKDKSPAYTLKYHFIPGQVLKVSAKTVTDTQQNQGNQNIVPFHNKSVMLGKETIVSVSKNGTATIKMTWQSFDGNPIQKTVPKGSIELFNTTTKQVVTPYGRKISEITAMSNDTSVHITNHSPDNAWWWGLPLPENPVQVGEQWTVELKEPEKTSINNSLPEPSVVTKITSSLVGIEDYKGTPAFHIQSSMKSEYSFTKQDSSSSSVYVGPDNGTIQCVGDYWLSRNGLTLLHISAKMTRKDVIKNTNVSPSGKISDHIVIATYTVESDFTGIPPKPKTKPTTVKPPK